VTVPKIVGIENRIRRGTARRGRAQSGRRVQLVDQRLRRANGASVGLRGRVRPGATPRGSRGDGAQPPEIETISSTRCSPTAARYYVDHAHPEYSTPECADPLEATLFDKAGERILARSMEAARRLLPRGRRSSSTRTTATARATSTVRTRTISSTANVPVRRSGPQLIPWFRDPPGVHGRGQGRCRERREACDYRSVSAPTFRRGGRARDHVEAPESSTRATNRTPIRRSTAAST